MKKILIFKTDRVGDLINITPVINNIKLNYPNCEIDIVCSQYNSQIAKYINDINKIFIYKNSIIKFIFFNFVLIFKNKYDSLFQLDGKNHSYFLSLIFNAKNKYSLRFIKNKNIFNKTYKVIRPNILYNFFFKHINCHEDYSSNDNKLYHYLSLYFKLLEKANLQIFSNNHILKYHPKKINTIFDTNYVLLHIDEKWENFDAKVHLSLIKFLSKLTNEKKVIVTSNIGENLVFNKIFYKFNNKQNIKFIKGPSFSDLISIVYFSQSCVSSHSGFIVHLAACYNKKIIDIVDKNIFNELDRWIPFNINYERLDIENFNNHDFI